MSTTPLKNERHERFAQELAKGTPQIEAYCKVGYAANEANASRLAARGEVRARVATILGRAAERAEITAEMVLRELAKIGFSDIRKTVRWYSQTNVAAVDLDKDADVAALAGEGEIRFAVANQVELISSDDLDDDTAGAIAEVGMSSTGTLKVKLHDKRAALVDIGRHLGMFKDRVSHENPDGSAINPVVIFKLPDNGR